jgi:hypothetical protein
VPVLYSLASRFTGARSTRDLDALFDAAQERRFKPIGGRGAVVAPVVNPGDGVGGTWSVSVILEPEPGRQGDRAVLEKLASSGLSIAPIPGTAKVRVTIPNVEAKSEADAKNAAVSMVMGMLPREGYVVSNPELNSADEAVPAAMAQSSG